MRWARQNRVKTQENLKNHIEKDPESYRAKRAERYRANRGAMIAYTASWAKLNPDKARANKAKWKAENPQQSGLDRVRRAKAKHRVKLSKIERARIKEIYKKCAEISKATGIRHHVDHIIPLRSPLVCGLHVSWNLQIIPAAENLRKGNRLS
jgi:hypothetical protein